VITGFGIGWASMMGIPNGHPQHSEERYGVYMGNHKYDDCDPMFIQTITFGYVLKTFEQRPSTSD
jgi:maltose/moltooligosaccharide transporter